MPWEPVCPARVFLFSQANKGNKYRYATPVFALAPRPSMDCSEITIKQSLIEVL